MKQVEAVAKQIPTEIPGNPMSANNLRVLRPPFLTSINANKNSAAQTERQKTMVQLSPVVIKCLSAPPKLQTMAEARTRTIPKRVSGLLLVLSWPVSGDDLIKFVNTLS